MSEISLQKTGGPFRVCLTSFSLGNVASKPGQGRGVRHVNVDCMAMAKWDGRRKLDGRAEGMSKGDDSVQANLVQVRALELCNSGRVLATPHPRSHLQL